MLNFDGEFCFGIFDSKTVSAFEQDDNKDARPFGLPLFQEMEERGGGEEVLLKASSSYVIRASNSFPLEPFLVP
jgi:hypothetical protein